MADATDMEIGVFRRSRRSTIVGDVGRASQRSAVRRTHSRSDSKDTLPTTAPASASPTRRLSYVAKNGQDESEISTRLNTISVGSFSSMASPLGKSPTFRMAPTRPSATYSESQSVENSPVAQKRYHDISKGVSMANFKASSRSHRQLRPLRKGIVGMSEADLQALGQRLRLAFHENRIVKNRRWRLVLYPAAFAAIDAIEWLVGKGDADTQQQAITIMLCLQRNGIIYNLLEAGNDFSGGHAFFRFRADDASQPTPPVYDLVDMHTANQLRAWACRSKTVICEHTRDRKAHRLTFVPSEFVSYLATANKECNLSESSLVTLCQLLQESGALVQVYSAEPSVFKTTQSMLFRFRQDQVSLEAVSDDARRRSSVKPPFAGSGLLPRWMSSTEGLSAAVKNPISRAKTMLVKTRREATTEGRQTQVYRPEIWNGSNVTLVSSLQDQWGFTLVGTSPVCVASVDSDGPARKLLRPGDIILRVDKLDVFRMTGPDVMSVISDGKPFFQATIFRRPTAESR